MEIPGAVYTLPPKHSKELPGIWTFFSIFHMPPMVEHRPAVEWGSIREIVIADFVMVCPLSVLVFTCDYNLPQFMFIVFATVYSLGAFVTFPKFHSNYISLEQMKTFHKIFVFCNILFSMILIISATIIVWV